MTQKHNHASLVPPIPHLPIWKVLLGEKERKGQGEKERKKKGRKARTTLTETTA